MKVISTAAALVLLASSAYGSEDGLEWPGWGGSKGAGSGKDNGEYEKWLDDPNAHSDFELAPFSWMMAPTKLQYAVMSKQSYGRYCSSEVSEGTRNNVGAPPARLNDPDGDYGKAWNIGNWHAQVDPFPQRRDGEPGHYRMLLEVDHGCLVDSPAQEYLCHTGWQDEGSGGDWDDTCNDGMENCGSAGLIYRSGQMTSIPLDAYQEAWTLQTEKNGDLMCVMAIRGTDDFPFAGSSTLVGANNPDVESDRWWEASEAINDLGDAKLKGRMYKYYKYRISPQIEHYRSSMPECIQWSFTGHSLGGSLASMAVLFEEDDGPLKRKCQGGDNTAMGIPDQGGCDQVFSFGALPIMLREVDGGGDTIVTSHRGGFRLFHEQDFAINIHYTKYAHVHGSTGIWCPPNPNWRFACFGWCSRWNHQGGDMTLGLTGHLECWTNAWNIKDHMSEDTGSLGEANQFHGSNRVSRHCEISIPGVRQCTGGHHGVNENYIFHMISGANARLFQTPGFALKEAPPAQYLFSLQRRCGWDAGKIHNKAEVGVDVDYVDNYIFNGK